MTTPAAPAAPHADAPKKIHIFKPGRHVTMAGEVIEFSQADIEATARAYNPKLARSPLVVGHPKTDDPAQGWVSGMTATDQGLYAQVDQVDPAFAEAVRQGRYGALSAKFYRPSDAGNPVPGVWYLRHVGFLGAAAPAVKGLEAPAFAAEADDDGCVRFAEAVAFSGWAESQAAGLWRNLREWLIAKFGQDDADRVLPQYAVAGLETQADREMRRDEVAPAAFAAAPTPPAAAAAPSPQESTVTEQEAQQLRDQSAAQQREIDELRSKEAKRAADAMLAENVAFAEQLVREARIPTAQQALVAAVGAQLQQSADVAFGEGKDSQPLHQAFRTFMQALPPKVGLAEQATRERAATAGAADPAAEVQFAQGEVDADRLALDGRIRAHAAEKKLSYAAAANALMRSGR